jgi:hypothetical protein
MWKFVCAVLASYEWYYFHWVCDPKDTKRLILCATTLIVCTIVLYAPEDKK